MDKSFRFLVVAVFILFVGANVFAQSHEMVLKIPTQATYINQIIMGDTLSNGKRADDQRVYVLERGGMWFFNGVIKNIGWDIRIKASEGTGPLPIIYGTVEKGGSNIAIDFIDAQGNVSLKNIIVNGVFDMDPDYVAFKFGAPKEIVCFYSAGDYSLTVDGCIISNAYQANLRTFGGMRSFKITNTIFANNGTAPWKGVGDGRAVDLRNVSIDTLLMVNCTVVNGNDRAVRHIASTGRLKNFIFEHNTVLNMGGRYGVINLGLVGDKVQIKNNLFIDPMTFGADTASQRQYDFKENGEAFSTQIPAKTNMCMVYTQKETTPYATKFDISNNYYYFTPEIQAAWDKIKAIPANPVLRMPNPLSDFIASQITNPTTAFTKLTTGVTFTKTPKPMADFVYWNLSPAPTGAGENSSGGTAFKDFDRKTSVYHRDTLNCSYPTTHVVYTAGTKGYPVGDLNWFPTKKTAWLAAGGWTSVEQTNSEIPVSFNLDQNYPNPFNPTTKISYSIPKASQVRLEIYDILGSRIETLVNNMQNAGNYNVDFDASKYSSGVYIYRLITNDYTISKKMMLMK